MEKIALFALPGIQAENLYYVVQMTFEQIVSCFEFFSDSLPIESRYQRQLNLKRASNFAQYLLNNYQEKLPYTVPTLTASVTKCEFDQTTGMLTIPEDARLIINDGQHRRAGIEEAIKNNTLLAQDTAAVMLILDPELKRAQQIFSDINFNAKPVTKSLSLTFNKRDADANTTQVVVNRVPLFYRFTEREKNTVNTSATKVFLFSNLHQIISKIFDVLQEEKQQALKHQQLIAHYFNCLAQIVEPYNLLINRLIIPKNARKDYIVTHNACLDGFAQLGAKLLVEFIGYKIPTIEADGKKQDNLTESEIYKKLLPLADLDLKKTNYDFNSTVIYDGTEKVISNNSTKNWLADYFSKAVLGAEIHTKPEKNGKIHGADLDVSKLASIK